MNAKKIIILFLVLSITILLNLEVTYLNSSRMKFFGFFVSSVSLVLSLLGVIKFDNYILIELCHAYYRITASIQFTETEKHVLAAKIHHITAVLAIVVVYTIAKKYKFLYAYGNSIHIPHMLLWLSRILDKKTTISKNIYKLYLVSWAILLLFQAIIIVYHGIKDKNKIIKYGLFMVAALLGYSNLCWTKYKNYYRLLE